MPQTSSFQIICLSVDLISSSNTCQYWLLVAHFQRIPRELHHGDNRIRGGGEGERPGVQTSLHCNRLQRHLVARAKCLQGCEGAREISTSLCTFTNQWNARRTVYGLKMSHTSWNALSMVYGLLSMIYCLWSMGCIFYDFKMSHTWWWWDSKLNFALKVTSYSGLEILTRQGHSKKARGFPLQELRKENTHCT